MQPQPYMFFQGMFPFFNTFYELLTGQHQERQAKLDLLLCFNCIYLFMYFKSI